MRFVPATGLQVGMIIGRDILDPADCHMLRRGVALTADYIHYIQSKGYMGVYISDRMSAEVLLEETVEPETFKAGMEAVREQNIGEVINVATDIVSQVYTKSDVSPDLLDIRPFDDYTFHHCVNVGIYAVLVGKKMGLSEDDLKLLCQAGMVHDLGKLNIPLQILTKEGPLTDEEYEIMKAHPRYSFEILSDNHGVSSMVKQAVLMHHENLNGSGYPLGKAGDDIPLFAKILHVVDVYDALISKRPYKEPYASADALEYIEGGKGILFDPQVVDAMTASVPMYPPGIDVYLSNGEQALVVAYTSNAKRPKVKILATDALVDLSTNKEYQDIYIKSSAAMPQDYVGEIPALNEDRQNVVERRKRIMLVDSMQVSLMQTQAALGHEYDYIICKNGVEALISLSHKAEKPDLVIMDIVMEDMDGIEVAKKIKSRLDDTPMIFLTASGDRETVLACSKVGAVDYILKPAKPVYIRERVAYALKEQRE